jgi:acetoin utilization deacetylase AcuC-like enzyme
MTTAYYFHTDFLGHDMGAGHPECARRLKAIESHLASTDLAAVLQRREDVPLAARADLQHAHNEGYLLELGELLDRAEATGDLVSVDPDTRVGPGTRQAMLRAAGAAVAATDAVLDGEVDNAFCCVRPPGHHATRDQALGFCFANNVAIAARHALDVRGLERVAIVDFDVHHGNGTEDIIAGDDRVLMLSFFQDPLFPYSGGVPMGTNMVNVPLAARAGGAEVRELVQTQWLPALEAFRPEMVFISAGFDAHREDDMAQMQLEDADFAWLTEVLVEAAARHAGGRIVSCLEGGYMLKPLARCVEAHLRALAGQPSPDA